MIENFISEELIQALGWTMIHSLWQGFAIAIMMGLVMIVLQNKSSKVRYEFAWFSLFSIFVLSLSTFIYLYDSIASGWTLGTTITVVTENGIPLENAHVVQGFFQKGIAYFNQHIHLIVTLWLMGMGFFLLRLLGGLAYVQRLKTQQQQALPAAWQHSFEKLQAQFPIKKTVRIAESGLAKVPMVIGFFKPVILFPMSAINQLSQAEVEAVLAHELAHIYRNDYLLNIIQSFIEIIFYYHPAVWWISANIRTERENCCDDIAVKLCGNSLTYVKALVNLEENQAAPSLAMSFSSGRKKQLLNRVKRILNQPQNKINIMEKFAATCFLLGVLLFFSVSATEPATPQNEEELLTEINLSEVNLPETHFPKNQKNETQSETGTNASFATASASAVVSLDTIPATHRGGKFVFSGDEKAVEVEYEDGEIKRLKIDGEQIPKSEFPKYETYVNELMDDIPSPPTPPLPDDSFFNTPPAPPVPPRPSSAHSKVYIDDDQNIVIKKMKDGKTIILNGSAGSAASVDDDGTIRINGEVVEMDDDLFLTIEMPEIPELPEIPEMNFNYDFDYDYDFDTIPTTGIWIDGEEIDYDSMTEEEKQAYKERMQEVKEQLREAQQSMKEEMKKMEKLNKEEYKQQMKEVKERMKEATQHLKEAQKMQKERANKMREEQRAMREEQRRLRKEERKMRDETRRLAQIERNKWLKAYESEMRKDGFIKSDGSYKFSMNEHRLKVNGKKQSKALFEKYKKLYESSTGGTLGNDFSISLKTDGKNNRNNSISISKESTAN
ncbi:MAG TPA: hypothetical protein ENJ53_05750 [Phaeodactylibacter sp.]|nr:hypothetical protein [Phaeodactylibacter sp.]